MKIKKHVQILGIFVILFLFILASCDDAAAGTKANLTLAITGLEDLGANFAYEGWIMVDGKAVTTGVFSVNAAKKLSKTVFSVSSSDLEKATAFILSIEPKPDTDPKPTKTHILAGGFSGKSSTLTVGHTSALGNDFTKVTGSYILATPTDGDGPSTNERSGVWWLKPATSTATAGLENLPTLPAGWKYEGWAVIDDKPVSTGTFLSATGADDTKTFSGTTADGPLFPGEDFLLAAPAGLTFPTDLRGKNVVISVEPDPDNSPNPFGLKPLVHTVAADAVDHTPLTMDNKAAANFPKGTAKR